MLVALVRVRHKWRDSMQRTWVITLADVGPDLCRYMVPVGHNGLNCTETITCCSDHYKHVLQDIHIWRNAWVFIMLHKVVWAFPMSNKQPYNTWLCLASSWLTNVTIGNSPQQFHLQKFIIVFCHVCLTNIWGIQSIYTYMIIKTNINMI